MSTFAVSANASKKTMPILCCFSPCVGWGISSILMPWRNSVFFPIVLFPLLALVALTGLLIFYSFPLTPRPHFLWYSAVLLGVAAVISAIIFGSRLRHRLRSLATFLTMAPGRELSPSLPVWGEDEVGALERGLQQV